MSTSDRQAIDKMAQRISEQSKITHKQARSIVVRHITRAENKKRG